MEFITGKYYRIKKDVKMRVSNNKLRYCGIDEYQGKKHHNFFDEKTRLFYWLRPDEVEKWSE